MIAITREELRALLGSPAAMREIANHHSVQETLASGFDMEGCADWHRQRMRMFEQEATRLQQVLDAGDEDPRPAIESVPCLNYQD